MDFDYLIVIWLMGLVWGLLYSLGEWQKLLNNNNDEEL